LRTQFLTVKYQESGDKLNIEEITFIHEYLVKYFKDKEDPISPEGIKNNNLLESAVARPFMSIGREDAFIGIFNKSAALFHSLINNHCFHNGNKRVALLTTMSFLGENGYWLIEPNDNELLEFTRQAAAHEICVNRDDELECISDWLRQNSRRRRIGENTLKMHELKDILAGFGFDFNFSKNGKTIEICKNKKLITKIIRKGKNGSEDYDKQYIQRLRKKLKLTAAYGIDSYQFYGKKGFEIKLSKLMILRHDVMRELAQF
jgi:death-on-curing protein